MMTMMMVMVITIKLAFGAQVKKFKRRSRDLLGWTGMLRLMPLNSINELP